MVEVAYDPAQAVLLAGAGVAALKAAIVLAGGATAAPAPIAHPLPGGSLWMLPRAVVLMVVATCLAIARTQRLMIQGIWGAHRAATSNYSIFLFKWRNHEWLDTEVVETEDEQTNLWLTFWNTATNYVFPALGGLFFPPFQPGNVPMGSCDTKRKICVYWRYLLTPLMLSLPQDGCIAVLFIDLIMLCSNAWAVIANNGVIPARWQPLLNFAAERLRTDFVTWRSLFAAIDFHQLSITLSIAYPIGDAPYRHPSALHSFRMGIQMALDMR